MRRDMTYVTLVAILAAAPIASAADLYVATDGDDGADCSTVPLRCQTVQRAVDVATGGETIKVAGGTYTDADTGALGQLVTIDKDVTLRGGYDASFTDPPDSLTNPTVLDAERNGRVISITNAGPTIEGFVVTGGMTTKTGAGISVEFGSPTIKGNDIVGNITTSTGGGLFVNRGSAEIHSNLVRQNEGFFAGGMIILNDAAGVVTENDIIANVAAVAGGGVSVSCCGGTTVRIERNRIIGNDGGGRGGGVDIDNTQVALANNFIGRNKADEGSTLHVSGIAGAPADVTSTHDTLVGDPLEAEAIWVGTHSIVEVANDIVTTHSTGVSNTDGLTSTVTVDHTLFHGNTLNYGANVVSTDESSGSPAFVDPIIDDYHILATSAARDVGTNTNVVDDIDGDMRPLGPATDVGADEFVPENTTTSTSLTPSTTTSTSTSSLSSTVTSQSSTSTSASSSTTAPPASTSTTTSTMPHSEHVLSGKKLVLKDDSGKPSRRRMLIISKDAGLSAGDGPGSADDPTLLGGSLRLVSANGGFDVTYALDYEGWDPLKKRIPGKGWKYSKGAAVKKVVLKVDKQLKIVGKGALLGHDLSSDPNPVDVVLTVGRQRFCMRLGGDTVAFKRGKRYLAKDAEAPDRCPAL